MAHSENPTLSPSHGPTVWSTVSSVVMEACTREMGGDGRQEDRDYRMDEQATSVRHVV